MRQYTTGTQRAGTINPSQDNGPVRRIKGTFKEKTSKDAPDGQA